MTKYKSDTSLEIPWIINLELTNACNLSCIFCDYPILKKKMNISEMSNKLMQKIFSDVLELKKVTGGKIHELGLVGLGEPTLDRLFDSHISIVSDYAEHFERVSLNSNLVSLKPERVETLLNSGVNTYTFSVNASNRETYKQMMGADLFDAVINNLNYFLAKLSEMSKKVMVDLQVVESKHNSVEELKDLIPLAGELNINIFFRKMYSKPVIQESTDLVDIFDAKGMERYPCWDIYSRIYIDYEGNVYPCTIGNDSYRETSGFCLGNVERNSILEIFNNKRISEARERNEKGGPAFPECSECNIWSIQPNNFIFDINEKVWKKKESQKRAFGLK
jgi:radical SAM protein with 4Fe4S-binding SPASM domain